MERTLVLLVCLHFLAVQVFSACDDTKNNIVNVADASSGNVIKVSNGVGYSYDAKNVPSCYKNVANLQLPGIVNLASGQIDVGQQLKVIGNSKALLTLKKNSILIGYVCQDGKSKNLLVPDDYCNIDVCTISKSICAALEQPGVHQLGELEGDLGINGTIVLPSLPSAFKSIIKGQWKLEVKLQVGDQIVLHVKAPSNSDWLWIDE